MSDFSRRDFMKVAGTTAGVAVAAGYTAFSYSQNEKVHVACIGTGGQGGFHIRFGLNQNPDIEIVAVCDVYKPHLEAAWGLASGAADNDGKPQREVKKYMDYRKLLDEMGEQIDAVVIATPLHEHYHIAMDCLDAGKHVFLEKTMAYDIEEVRNIVQKVHDSGKIMQIGHQRRYNPEYNKCVWLARGSAERASLVGRINHVSAHWHRNNDWRRPVDETYQLSAEEKQWIEDLEKHINWRLYKDRSRGGLITELATHQLDVTNWFLGSMPSRVTAYGGIDYWRDGRDVHDNIVMIYEYDIDRSDASFAVIPPRNSEQRRAELGRPYTVRFTYSSICANAHRTYGEWVHGDRGSFKTTEQHGCMFYPEPAAAEDWNAVAAEASGAEDAAKAITSGKTRDFKPEDYQGMPVTVFDDMGKPFEVATTVDRMQFTAFANDIRKGGTPKANQMVGLMSAVCGFAAIESMDKGGVTVEIDPASYAFDFETPDPFRFDFFEDPNFKKTQSAGA